MTWLLVALGAAVGAPLRYLADRALRGRVFPWGTFAVNVAGSFALGALTGVGMELHLLLGTGLCGALTTYSTFSYETLRLARTGAPLLAAANVVAAVAGGLAAVVAGTALVA
ncbi:hypothetical protein GCM10023148_01050 [Actinokineospora soli]